MAIDTRNKRASALGRRLRPLLNLPTPDGTISAPDRRQVVGLYRFADATITETEFLSAVSRLSIDSADPRQATQPAADRNAQLDTEARVTLDSADPRNRTQ